MFEYPGLDTQIDSETWKTSSCKSHEHVKNFIRIYFHLSTCRLSQRCKTWNRHSTSTFIAIAYKTIHARVWRGDFVEGSFSPSCCSPRHIGSKAPTSVYLFYCRILATLILRLVNSFLGSRWRGDCGMGRRNSSIQCVACVKIIIYDHASFMMIVSDIREQTAWFHYYYFLPRYRERLGEFLRVKIIYHIRNMILSSSSYWQP